MATRKQGSIKDAPRPVKAGGGEAFGAPEKRSSRTVGEGNPAAAPRPLAQSAPQTVRGTQPLGRQSTQVTQRTPVTQKSSEAHGGMQGAHGVQGLHGTGKRPGGTRRAASAQASARSARAAVPTSPHSQVGTPSPQRQPLRRPMEIESPARPVPRSVPPQQNLPLKARVAWRNVGESGEEGDYKAPQFKGAVREYVPKEEPHASAQASVPPHGKDAARIGGQVAGRQAVGKVAGKASGKAPVRNVGRDALKTLQEQTPNRRRERVKRSRRQNLESLHRANFRLKFRMVEKKKRPRGFYLKVIGATLALYLLFLGGFAAFFASNLLKSSLQEQESVSYTIGVKGTEGYVKAKIRYGTLFRDGVMYLNMNHIAALCDLTTTGDLTRMRYYSRGEIGHSVLFFIGSRTALINGTPVTLEGPSYLEGDTVYVAADFFTRFVSGLDLFWDAEKNALSVTRVVIATSMMKGDQYAEVTFGLDPSTEGASIDFSELDLELRMQIEAMYGDEIPPASDDDDLPEDGENPDDT